MVLRTSYILMLLGVLAMALSGCEKEEGRVTGYGTMNIRLSANSNVIEVGASSNTRSNTSKIDSVTVTRAEILEDIVPDADDFKIALYKDATTRIDAKEITPSYQWDRLEDFDPDTKLPIGVYTLKATYGEWSVEGFGASYYEGVTDMLIQDHQNTSAEVTCYLSNVKVSILCSDVVRKYFSTFEIKARSQVNKEIEISKDEERPFYMQPGSLTITAHLVKQNGKEATVQLARIPETEARQHYIINVELNEGNAGGAVLNVVYSQVKSEETVKIDLSDESLSMAAPTFATTGIPADASAPIELREGAVSDLAAPVKVTLNARAGIKSCVLNIKSAFLLQNGVPKEIDLAVQDEQALANKKLLESFGLRIIGLDVTMDKMALIDFSDLITKLQYIEGAEADIYTLTATDVVGKTTITPITFSVLTRSNQFALLSDAQEVMIGSTESQATVALDAEPDDISKIIFQYKEGESWRNAEAEHVSTEGINHVVKIKKLSPVSRELTIRACYGSKISEEKHLGYYIPEFRVEPVEEEIWSDKATLQVVSESGTEAETAAIVKYVSWECNGQRKTGVQKFSFDGLKANTDYSVNAICNEGGDKTLPKTQAFRTEGGDLENWNFESWNTLIDTDINNGGKHTCWSHVAVAGSGYYVTAPFKVEEPIAWCTVNSKTVHEGIGNQNTWYMVASTDKAEGIKNGESGVILKNVAWDNAGETIDTYAYPVWPPKGHDKVYNTSDLNYPGTIKYSSAGRLFLGKYTYDHSTNTEVYDEGISFTSRPSSFSFYYKYKAYPAGIDKGYVRALLEHREDGKNAVVLAESYLELEEKSDYTKQTVEFDYKAKGFVYGVSCPKATHIKLMFCSSKNGISMNQGKENQLIILPKISEEECRKVATVVGGSELYIDNVKFEY